MAGTRVYERSDVRKQRSYEDDREVCMKDPSRPVPDVHLEVASRDAQTEFIQRNLRRIFLQIYRAVGNVDDAQDLTQETFIKALQRFNQLKDLQKAEQWLSRIATNTTIDYLRRRKKNAFSDIEEAPASIMVSRESDPEQLVMRSQTRGDLDGGLAKLTGRERMALLLRDVEEISTVEVARRMNCSMATVRSHIANARVKFRRYLESRNG
jgi:RNA polymerase sigma-70 factor, ECF subfamily